LAVLVISESKILGKDLKNLKIEEEVSVHSHTPRNLENNNYIVFIIFQS